MHARNYTHEHASRPVSTGSHPPVAIIVPSRETLQSALHWLTAHPPPPELQDMVATLVVQDLALITRSA